ncbi:Gfo/Idh/MocA family protein [Paenibacillus agaridevorans]|uniref:Gfo/Idh/MocA family protein n=1 Tax=Paenibacillus agaridevorans TaxID=171404 RepID=UPI001BE4A591|nr:Gfo/Idh/MocA family oxidoreductase [Paenibacillus agaridevorans]
MMEKIKVGLLGFGGIGQAHYQHYQLLEKEGSPIQLQAICDANLEQVKRVIGGEHREYDLYTKLTDMLRDDTLDYIDICLPTYLHAEASIEALRHNKHVFCEKPMALNSTECQAMIKAAEDNNRLLMIAQCLRFMTYYRYLKDCVASGRLGKVISADFFRGANPPLYSANRWMLDERLSGGGLLDLHIHDVDMIYWLFGRPEWVSAVGQNVYEGSGYDVVSAHFGYGDQKVIHAASDWSLEGDYEFQMTFRVNFERGNLVLTNEGLKENLRDGGSFIPDLDDRSGIYGEIKYFADVIRRSALIETVPLADSLSVIQLIESERASIEQNGAKIKPGWN